MSDPNKKVKYKFSHPFSFFEMKPKTSFSRLQVKLIGLVMFFMIMTMILMKRTMPILIMINSFPIFIRMMIQILKILIMNNSLHRLIKRMIQRLKKIIMQNFLQIFIQMMRMKINNHK